MAETKEKMPMPKTAEDIRNEVARLQQDIQNLVEKRIRLIGQRDQRDAEKAATSANLKSIEKDMRAVDDLLRTKIETLHKMPKTPNA